MSGFEVIGVILGVYPLIVNALEVYKATKAGKQALSLARNLKTEEIIFGEFVYHLLAPNVSEADLVRLKDPTSPDLDLWKNITLQANLRDRLGSEKAGVVVEALQEINELLRSLQDELSPTKSDHGVELLRRFRASVRNVRHNLPRSSLSEGLDKLTTYNNQLQRLLTDRSLPCETTLKARSVPTRRYLRRDSSHAIDVYNAICDGYRCNCDAPHFANLGLPLISEDPQADKNGLISGWQFKLLLFPIDDSGKVEDASSLEFERLKAAWSQLNIGGTTASSTRRLRHKQSRPISIWECDDNPRGEQQGPIQDLCIFVKTLDTNVPVSNTHLGILRLKEKQYELQAPLSVQGIADSQNIVYLDELLSSRRFLLPRKERMGLALKLSYAILQFYSTPWIEACWTWRDFCIDKRNDSQLFVARKFYSTRSRALTPGSKRLPTSGFWAIHGEPILTRLGFALIELALGESLAELRPEHQDNGLDPDALDFITARNLVKSGCIMREEGRGYEDVVKACLNHQFISRTDLLGLDSSRSNFQENVEKCIIAPLYTMWTSSWGNL